MALYKPQYKDSNGNMQDLNIKAGDTVLFNSQQPSYYLDYNNLINKPSIPSTTTANKVLLSTATSGTTKWSDWSTAGYLKTSNTGVVTVETSITSDNSDKVDNLHMLDQTYAYTQRMTITVGCVDSVVNTGLTEAQIFALTGNLYGRLYLASDTGKYWRRKNTQTTASSDNWRNDTTACTTSKALANQLTTEDAIYIKVDTKTQYYSRLPKFFVEAGYDNISGTTQITGFCRQQNQFDITSCSYNGNNLIGIYQPTANTNIYYLKFTKYRSTYGATASYDVVPVIYTNFNTNTPELTFISKNHADYATVSGYSYIAVPSYGNDRTNINGNWIPRDTKVQNLGSTSKYWNNIYGTTIYENGTLLSNKYQAKDADLTAIAGIGDSSTGFLKKTAANTWSVGSLQASDIPSLSSSYVDLTTNQNVDGVKTFLDRPLSKDTYTQLEYIESPATSASVFPYIRTGVKRGDTYTSSQALSCILDGYFLESQTHGFNGYDSGGQLGQSSGKWSTESGVSSVSALTRATILQVINFPSSYDRLYQKSGDTYSQIASRSIGSAGNYATAADYPLFVAYNGAYSYRPGKLRMYSFKMYAGDYYTSPSTCTLLRDFVPAKNAQNEIGLLDLVENKFYKNLGNEDFTAGSSVETLEVSSQLLTSGDVAKVALSNNYNDLDGKPTIPTVSNSTITISQTDISDQTFTLNGSAKTISLNDTKYTFATGTTAGAFSVTPNLPSNSSAQTVSIYGWNDKLDIKPNGTDLLIESNTNKISTKYLPDFVLGQLLFGGTVNASTAVATLSDNAKIKLGTSSTTITLTNDTTAITGYKANEGVYYIVTTAGTFASISFAVGDWLISNGSAWKKVDNTDEVTSVTIGASGVLSSSNSSAQTGPVSSTITHNAGSAVSVSSGWYKFSTDAYSHIASTTAVTSTDLYGLLANTGNVTFTDSNSKISASVTFPVSDVQTKTTTSGSYASVVTSNVAKIDLSGYATTSSLSDYVTLTGTQAISGKKTFSHADGVITTSKFVVQDESIVTSFDEDKIVRTDVQGGGTLVQTLNYPTFSSTSQTLTIATEDKIKNGLLTINVNDDESEFYANSASDVYVTIALPRVKRYI